MPGEKGFVYRGSKTRELSFPLGGIGTGSIGLAGNGRLIDWEIFNRPNKGSYNGFSHFAIRAERDGKVIDTRVLHGDLHPPYSGSLSGPNYNSFGFGPNREYLSGLPHFREVDFRGEFPLAHLEFLGADFPGEVKLLAFNPFIPLNEFDSGIPAAFFEFEVTNTSPDTLDYLLLGALSNPLPANQIHTLYAEEQQTYLHLRSDSPSSTGDLTLAISGGEISAQAFWFRGAWFDSLEVYWRELSSQPGELKPRSYPVEHSGASNTGCLASRFTLDPGETRQVRFVIAWNFSNVENYWNEATKQITQSKGIAPRWKNYYATRFENSFASAQYALEHWQRLYAETLLFQQTLFSATLDPVVVEAISANLAVLKSATVLRLEDGTFYGFEGCHPNAGCCEGSCTHVWNYSQAVPFLFPALERSMRAADFTLNQRADGAMRFRLPLPNMITAEEHWVFHPCADGQFGNVLKAYANWKISGDTPWLKQHWPAIKRSIEFAWAPTNEYRWDPQRSGVLSGRQHHTLDMELFGPSSWLNGFYLAALKAGAEIAQALGDRATAEEYQAIFSRGKEWSDQHLFNGEYYIQQVDLHDRSLLETFSPSGASMVGSLLDAYWDEEHSEIKYQIGEGCEIDQLLAQWHANLYGLGEIFDPEQAKTALGSLYRYNFKPGMRDYYNPCRVFALNDEGGLVMCEWPEQARKPIIPVPYSQEVMTGFEYAAAILMIQSGMLEQGLEIVHAIRDRYDGEKRNPWNEIECGSNYARSMASYGLLLAFSGFEFDLPNQRVGFNPPRLQDGLFQTFWSLGSGWGSYRQTPSTVELTVLAGTLELACLRLPFLAAGEIQSAVVDHQAISFQQPADQVIFTPPLQLNKDTRLILSR
jgi:non-lysosomal glucosylceramidase